MPVINVPTPAMYGRSSTGAWDAQDDWWGHQQDNDQQQKQVGQAGAYANQQAGLGQSRGPTAGEDRGLARNEASGAGGNQQNAIGLAGTLAAGQQPSQAAYQLQAGLNQGVSQQTSLANSARGGAALATAGANRGANTAAMQQNAYTQGGLLRSRDMAAGRGMLGTGLGQQQAQDQQRLGQASQMGQYNAQANDRYSLGMGQAAVGLGQANNGASAQDLAWYQGGMAPVDAQSEANQQGQVWLSDARKQADAANKENDK